MYSCTLNKLSSPHALDVYCAHVAVPRLCISMSAGPRYVTRALRTLPAAICSARQLYQTWTSQNRLGARGVSCLSNLLRILVEDKCQANIGFLQQAVEGR